MTTDVYKSPSGAYRWICRACGYRAPGAVKAHIVARLEADKHECEGEK